MTTLSQSEPGSKGNEAVSTPHFSKFQDWSFTIRYSLVLYPGRLLLGVESYPSAVGILFSFNQQEIP